MLKLIVAGVVNFALFILGLFLIVFGAWMSLPEFVRALVTSIVLFILFLFATRNTRKKIYEEIDRKEREARAEKSY